LARLSGLQAIRLREVIRTFSVSAVNLLVRLAETFEVHFRIFHPIGQGPKPGAAS
jgi:hypothetical protein